MMRKLGDILGTVALWIGLLLLMSPLIYALWCLFGFVLAVIGIIVAGIGVPAIIILLVAAIFAGPPKD